MVKKQKEKKKKNEEETDGCWTTEVINLKIYKQLKYINQNLIHIIYQR